MYCSKCGAEIENGAAFCSSCGTPVVRTASGQKDVQPTGELHTEAPKQEPVKGPAPAHQAKAYYVTEFEKLEAGKRSKFNWAAFLLGPYHQMYHESRELFRKTFLPCMIVSFVVLLVVTAATVIGLQTLNLVALGIAGAAGLISGLLGVWALILSILYGKNCNQKLFLQVGGKAENIPQNHKKAIKLAVLYLVVILVLQILPTAVPGMMESDDQILQEDEELFVDDQQDMTEEPEEMLESEDLIDEPGMSSYSPNWSQTFYESTNLYLTGCMHASDTEGDMGLDTAVLFGDSSVTVGEVFGEVFDSYWWDDSCMDQIAGQGYYCDMIGSDEDRQTLIRFSAVYDGVQILDAAIVENGDIRPLSEMEAAVFMADLYTIYHDKTHTEAVNLTAEIQGRWISDQDGTEVVIRDGIINGYEYTCNYATESMLSVWVQTGEEVLPLTIEMEDGKMYWYDGNLSSGTYGDMVDEANAGLSFADSFTRNR